MDLEVASINTVLLTGIKIIGWKTWEFFIIVLNLDIVLIILVFLW